MSLANGRVEMFFYDTVPFVQKYYQKKWATSIGRCCLALLSFVYFQSCLCQAVHMPFYCLQFQYKLHKWQLQLQLLD